MGITGLYTFLNSRPMECVKQINLFEMRNKTIAIDFTNVLYRFLHNNNTKFQYILSFIKLINRFQVYNINIIFVFDGLPPIEKEYVLKRKRQKKTELTHKLDTIMNSETIESEELCKKINKQLITMTRTHIDECKKLFNSLGILYIHLKKYEADSIFKFLLDNKYADACYTNDMDLIVYGCHTVLYDYDYNENTMMCVKYKTLLEELKITSDQFLYTCILSGTDYNKNLEYSKFENNLELIKQYLTIQNIITNLCIINYGKIKHFFNIPNEFEWRSTFRIFTEQITENAIFDIHTQLHRYQTLITKYTMSVHVFLIQSYLCNNIYKYDMNNIYAKKYIEIIKLRFNINLSI